MTRFRSIVLISLVAISVVVAGCANSGNSQEPVSEDGPPQASEVETEPSAGEPEAADREFSPALQRVVEKWTGDLDGMAERRYIRALVVHSRTSYFLDGARQRGITYEAMKEFEKLLNKRLRTRSLQLHIVFLPVRRDELIPALLAGRGDIAAANLTITPERRKLVDFSIPLMSNVSEVLVTGPSAPDVTSWDDLAGRQIHVRKSSSYFESLQRLNETRRASGADPVSVRPADEVLEDEDLLEMVSAGLMPATIVDSHKAAFWDQIFDYITVHSDLTASTGGEIGWAFRQDSPKLKAAIDEMAKTHRAGTLFGNILLKRYLRNTKYVRNAGFEAEMKKFRATVDYFKEYAAQYDFDWLLVMAQAYQESRLDQNLRSRVGAVGVMQLMPSTAAGPPISIPDVEKLESNVHAGVKYLRHIADQYFKDGPSDPINKYLFAFASYNAGPSRIARLRREAAAQGLDPDRWFRNVELIAAKRIGRETVQYVSNIYKYYLAYQLVLERQQENEAATRKP